MRVRTGINKMADDLYFIAQPMGKTFTGIAVLVGGRAALVDTGMPPAADEYILPALRQAGMGFSDVDIIVNTHWHGDHVGCNKQIKEKSGATIAIHVKDRTCLESLVAQRAEFYGRFPTYFPPPALNPANTCPVDLVLRAGDKLKLGRRQFEVLHLPGHTPGSIGLYDRVGRLLLSGDSIQGQGIEGHIAMVVDINAYLTALHEAERLAIDCVVMDHAYSPFDTAILTGADVGRLLRGSIQTMEQYITAMQTFAAGRRKMSLPEATDFLCANFGTQPRSLMAMCTADSILRKLGIARE